MPDFLADEFREYCSHLYGIMKNERLFHFTKSHMEHCMAAGIEKSGVKRIRLHDLRYPNHYKIQTFSIDAVYAVGFFEKKVWILFFPLVCFTKNTKEDLPWIYHIYRHTMRN